MCQLSWCQYFIDDCVDVESAITAVVVVLLVCAVDDESAVDAVDIESAVAVVNVVEPLVRVVKAAVDVDVDVDVESIVVAVDIDDALFSMGDDHLD